MRNFRLGKLTPPPPPPPPRTDVLIRNGWKTLFQPLRTLGNNNKLITLLSRAPHWVLALTVCALFLAVGAAVLDDYGMSTDEITQRRLALVTDKYVSGIDDELLLHWDRFYGVGFELPLLRAERLLGLEDSRSIHLLRHFLTHLFFVAGGFCCYLLAYRMFNNRLLALCALLLFLLHPRLYAHSFFNSKDLPFLSMFMIALYFTHRAFRNDTLWAFLACGIAVGMLTNIRIIGGMLFFAVGALRAFDTCYAFGRGEGEWKHTLITGGLFAAAALLTLYLTWPWLWGDPFGRFMEALMRMSDYPNTETILFRGEPTSSHEVPWNYIPVWAAITTPPVTLLLGIVGTAAVCYRGITGPGAILRNTELRFGFLLVGCVLLPVLAAALLGSTLYNDWRQMYFIYAPFCLLAGFGLLWLVSTLRPRSLRAGVYGLAGIGIATAVVAMVQIHPHQQVYFNFLVDRTTPEYLRDQYDLDYWGVSLREGFEYLLDRYPSSTISVSSPASSLRWNREALPQADRYRILLTSADDADFYITFRQHREFPIRKSIGLDEETSPTPVYARKVYGNTIMSVIARSPDLVNAAAVETNDEKRRSMVSGKLIIDADFQVYLDGRKLTYLKEPCTLTDMKAHIHLHTIPEDVNDLSEPRRQYGFDNFGFIFDRRGAMFDGKCVAHIDLPYYPIAGIRTSQSIPDTGRRVWSGEFSTGR